MNEEGSGLGARADLVELWRSMLRIRRFEERLADLVEERRIRTPCHLYIGQEAIAVGVCAALRTDDTVWGGHRSHGHYLAKGGDLRAIAAEIFGRQDGCSRGRGGSMHVIAREVGIHGTVPLVAATIPLAVGAGLAARLRGDSQAAVAFFGDGAVEEGHFHESMNLAALRRLPVLFVCEHNIYASHMHVLERRARDNIVDAAAAHGMPGFDLDGNDVLTVRRAARDAVARARAGDGPTLLVCRTFRWRGHVGPSWDMDVGVKRRDELGAWQPKDPIARLRRQILQAADSDEGDTTGAELDAIEVEVEDEIRDAIEFAESSPPPAVSELLDHVFAAREEDA